MAETEIRLTAFKEGEAQTASNEVADLMDKDVENLKFASDDRDDDSDDTEDVNQAVSGVVACRRRCYMTIVENRSILARALKIAFFVGVCVYLAFAFRHSFGDEQSLTLLGVVCFAVGYFIISRCIRRYGDRLKQQLGSKNKSSRILRTLRLIYWWVS